MTIEYEEVGETSWMPWRPGLVFTIALAVIVASEAFIVSVVSDRVSEDMKKVIRFELEHRRHVRKVWASIADSANIDVIEESIELQRAEEQIRRIYESSD